MNSIRSITLFYKLSSFTVQLSFKGPFSGTAALVFPSEDISKLVTIFTVKDTEAPDIASLKAGAINEMGNIIINAVMGSIGNMLKQRISYSIPTYTEDTIKNLLISNDPDSDTTILLAQTCFTLKELQIEGHIILLFKVGSFDALLAAIDTIIRDSGEQS